MISPAQQSRDLVMTWLSGKGLSKNAKLSSRSDAIIVEASVLQIEDLLNAKYDLFGDDHP